MQGIATSFVIWISLWLIVANSPMLLKPKHVKLEKFDELDAKNRIVSFIHGSLVMILAGYHFFTMPSECGDSNTYYEK